MTKQEILDGIDQAINVLLTYEQDEPTEKIFLLFMISKACLVVIWFFIMLFKCCLVMQI